MLCTTTRSPSATTSWTSKSRSSNHAAQPERRGVERHRAAAARLGRLVLGLAVDGVGVHDLVELGERAVDHQPHRTHADGDGVDGLGRARPAVLMGDRHARHVADRRGAILGEHPEIGWRWIRGGAIDAARVDAARNYRPIMVKRTEIVDAAVQVMRGGGPAAVTSVGVAARLGLTQSALYRYVRDVDELRTLAVERLLGELEADLTAAVVATGIGDANSTETAVFALRLVEATARHAVAFEVVDRFRFADGDLGAGIRAMLERGREFTASVLERRWQQAHKGVDQPARLRVGRGCTAGSSRRTSSPPPDWCVTVGCPAGAGRSPGPWPTGWTPAGGRSRSTWSTPERSRPTWPDPLGPSAAR